MASTIAAVTTGGGGVITTADSSGNLSLLSGATTVVAVTSTGVAVTGTLSATGAVTLTTALPVLQGGTGVTTSTGTGSVVLSASPTFTGNVTTPLSYVRLNTANGYGSTNNKIRRFTNIVNNVGTDITYADSATLGGTFTINTNGVYSVNYCDQTVGISELGLSIDSTQLTTQINAVTITNVLAITNNPGANRAGSVSATFYAAATSIVRAHTNGDATGAGTAQCTQFTIARVQ
jgi:hypothetical protein